MGGGLWEKAKKKVAKWQGQAWTWNINMLTETLSNMQHIREGMTEAEASAATKKDMAEAEAEQKKNRDKAWKDEDERIRQTLKDKQAKDTHSPQGYSYKPQTELTPWQQVGAYAGVSGGVLAREATETNTILRRLESLTQQQLRALQSQGRLF
jgi:hypothetical protein